MHENGICSKNYSRSFVTETQADEDGYPVHQQRDINNGEQVATLSIRGRTINIDNIWIIPCYPISFNDHINIDHCYSVKVIKYICKYINKGLDKATFSFQNTHNEVENYLISQYIPTFEAVIKEEVIKVSYTLQTPYHSTLSDTSRELTSILLSEKDATYSGKSVKNNIHVVVIIFLSQI